MERRDLVSTSPQGSANTLDFGLPLECIPTTWIAGSSKESAAQQKLRDASRPNAVGRRARASSRKVVSGFRKKTMRPKGVEDRPGSGIQDDRLGRLDEVLQGHESADPLQLLPGEANRRVESALVGKPDRPLAQDAALGPLLEAHPHAVAAARRVQGPLYRSDLDPRFRGPRHRSFTPEHRRAARLRASASGRRKVCRDPRARRPPAVR